MAQVTIADVAHNFDTGAIGSIFFIMNNIVLYRLSKTRPSGTRFEFLSGVKQRSTTTTAGIQARLMRFAVFAGECTLSTLLSSDTKFFRCKFFPPFVI